MQTKDILVIGAGKIGQVVADLLAGSGDYSVTLADRDAAALDALGSSALADSRVQRLALDVADDASLQRALDGRYAVLSAAPFHLTERIAEVARATGVHYLDLTEDVASTRRIRALAEGARSALIPQCGLAPGFIAIVAADLAARFERLDTVRLRVGALPAYPSNALNYNLTWSTDGVINEYIEPCEAIVDGRRTEVPALEEREEFALDGVLYEAFNTSGGLGTLCETLEGKVRTLNYRTIRYPGHAAIMKALLHDLRLRDRRDVLKDILENAVPTTTQDVVIIFVTVGRLARRPAGAGDLCAQDLQRNGRRPDPQRDPDHDRVEPGRDARPAGPGHAAATAASCARRTSSWPTSWATASARCTRRPRRTDPTASRGRGLRRASCAPRRSSSRNRPSGRS